MSASARNPQPSRRPRSINSGSARMSRMRDGLPRPGRNRAKPPALPPRSTPVPVRSLPPLLRMLVGLQRGSSAIAFVLIGSVLALYAATVYLQQQWSEAYQTLEKLQRETRNLTAADETFKHQLAKQAQDEKAGLVFPSPNQTIYLRPSAVQSVQKPPTEPQVEDSPSANAPLGY